MELSIIQSRIYEIRGSKVMLDFDLAEMYEVPTKALNQSVKRNIGRFPPDFMFQLTKQEFTNMLSQFVMTSPIKRPKSSIPYAFTEQGVAMLSGLLNSDVAIGVNINIMRAFVAVREYILSRASESVEIARLKERVLSLEQAKEQFERSDEDNLEAINDLSEDLGKEIENIYNAIGALSLRMPKLNKPRQKIGFKK